MVGAKHSALTDSILSVIDILRRFQICEHFGDFGQCFNLGKLPGGFGSATSLNHSSLISSKSKSESARTKRRKCSPDTVAHRQPSNTQTLISEFIALSESKKKLETLFTASVETGDKDTEDAEEKAMRDKLMRSLKQRRKDIADTIGE